MTVRIDKAILWVCSAIVLAVIIALIQTTEVPEGIEVVSPLESTYAVEADDFKLRSPVVEEFAEESEPVEEPNELHSEKKSKRKGIDSEAFASLPVIENGTILLRVVDVYGKPVKSASVFALAAKAENSEPVLNWQRPLKRKQVSGNWEKTGQPGEYLFTGRHDGYCRIGAWKKRMSFVATEALELGPHIEGRVVRLKLRPVPPSHIVSGFIVDETGEDSFRPQVKWRFNNGETVISAKGETEIVKGGWSFYFVTDSPEQRGAISASSKRFKTKRGEDKYTEYCYAVAENVTAGTTGIRLVLRKPRFVELDVRTEQNEEVETFVPHTEIEVDGKWVSAGALAGHGSAFASKPGKQLIQIPLEKFRVKIISTAYATETIGPYRGSEVGDELRARLKAKPVVEGVAISGGRPLTGAVVSLEGPSAAVESEDYDIRTGRTNGQGRFSITTEGRGTFVAELKSEGGITFRSSEFELDGVRDYRGLVLDVGSSACIYGRVSKVEAEPRQPRFVHFRNEAGDSEWISVPISSEGTYESSPLVAGTYTVAFNREARVRSRPQFELMDFGVGGRNKRLPVVPVDSTLVSVSVGVGERVELNFDASVVPKFTLQGNLQLVDDLVLREGERKTIGFMDSLHGGKQLATASLLADNARVISSSSIQKDGSFNLGSHSRGVLTLKIEWYCDTGALVIIEDQVDLREPTKEWNHSIELGTLRVHKDPDPFGYRQISYRASRPNGLNFVCEFTGMYVGGDDYELARIPSGTGTLILESAGQGSTTEIPVTINGGQELDLRVP